MAGAADTPNGDEPQAPPTNPVLKLLVYGMGIAIVIMMLLMIVGVSLGWHRKEKTPVAPDPTVQAALPAGNLVPLEISTARDSRLYTLAGDGARVALHIAAPSGDEIVVVDTSKNKIVSRIKLKPEGVTTP